MKRCVPAEQLEKLQAFFKEYPQIAAVYLFGSFGTEFQMPTSDIDLGVVFSQPVELKQELEIDVELSMFLNTDKVDFVNLARTPLRLQFKALKEGELVSENNPIANSNFIEKVVKQYWDYRISHDCFMQDYEVALKEVHASG